MSLRHAFSRGARALARRADARASQSAPDGARACAHRGSLARTFASNPIEDSDIFGKGGARGIDAYTSKGFVVGGVEHQGNVFLYEELSLLWGVKTPSDVTPETLVAAHAVDPPPDLLIVGCGDAIEQLPEETVAFFRDTETTLEVLDTPNAIATYNILVQEGRQVAAAMILPSS